MAFLTSRVVLALWLHCNVLRFSLVVILGALANCPGSCLRLWDERHLLQETETKKPLSILIWIRNTSWVTSRHAISVDFGRLRQTPTTNIRPYNAYDRLRPQAGCLRQPFEGYILYKPFHVKKKSLLMWAKHPIGLLEPSWHETDPSHCGNRSQILVEYRPAVWSNTGLPNVFRFGPFSLLGGLKEGLHQGLMPGAVGEKICRTQSISVNWSQCGWEQPSWRYIYIGSFLILIALQYFDQLQNVVFMYVCVCALHACELQS